LGVKGGIDSFGNITCTLVGYTNRIVSFEVRKTIAKNWETVVESFRAKKRAPRFSTLFISSASMGRPRTLAKS
jgi:hypothetical protein